MEAHAALALIQAVQNKRQREDSPDAAGGGFKRNRTLDVEEMSNNHVAPAEADVPMVGPLPPPDLEAGEREETQEEQLVLEPYPYFFYRDFSKEPDPDPLAPLTPPGRVPNFPAKMHAILSRADLSEIICWMPHGRSWRVLKPREFEVKVVPTYFEHAKFSSFIRQANGWGFRRVTQGRDRNCYYHELFLRGLPHLCKKMKRPAVAEKQAADPEHEPDFYKISEEKPVPEKAVDEGILLHCTIQGGPKARMPIYTGSYPPLPASVSMFQSESKPPAAVSSMSTQHLTPRDQNVLSGFQDALGASEIQLKALSFKSAPAAPSTPAAAAAPRQLPQQATPSMNPLSFLPPPAFLPNTMPLPFQIGGDRTSALAAANRLAFPSPLPSAPVPAAMSSFPSSTLSGNMPDVAAAQFAAGFAAATALSQHQLRSVLNSFTFIPRPHHT